MRSLNDPTDTLATGDVATALPAEDTGGVSAQPPRAGWINRYADLGTDFYTALPAQGLPDPHWVARSDDCAALLGWAADWADDDALQVLSGNALWPGMQSLATVYSGHQFGVWAGQLGDGRALWLGEVETPGGPMELQLKGAGKTPYSRMGDGRAVLRSSIREFLCSEAMHHLGIPTTRALCITGSTLKVQREHVETAAVVTRVAPSFIRFGHFEHFCHHGQPAALRQLFDFVVAHHYPACRDAERPALALLEEITRRTADLMAMWQSVGFCHGVMNTDNMSMLGLTIDYGPFGFLDAFDPQHICNHSDNRGRYAFNQQPQVGWWNLHALAQALLPLCDDDVDAVKATLQTYSPRFGEQMTIRLRTKLGLQEPRDGDAELIQATLALMAADHVDHTIFWRRLAGFDSRPDADNAPVRDLFVDRTRFDAWAVDYAARLRTESSDEGARAVRMNAVNPKYVLRNHLAETAIRAAERGDFGEIDRLLEVLRHPYDEQPANVNYGGFPPEWARQLEVSCSS